MTSKNYNNVAEVLSDGLDFSWMRERSHEELTSFIDRRHAALESIDLEF